MTSRPAPQRGAATLLLVLGLVLLATLASAWSSRAVLMDLLTTQTRSQSQQARHAAQAALATAESDLLQMFSAPAVPNPWPDPGPRTACPSGLQGLQWQCSRLPLAAGQTLGDWQLYALAARDLLASPHVWQIHATARASTGRGQASVRESLFVPVLAPIPNPTPPAAVLLNGCFSAAAGSQWQLCPLASGGPSCTGTANTPVVQSHHVPDADGNGLLSGSEMAACLAVPAHSLPGGGTVTGPATAQSRSPCSRAVWRSVLGDVTPAQLQAWSDAQARNGLDARSQPARTVYWVDSPADWTQSLGSPQAPVLLVFSSQACASRCPRMAAGVQIHGTVYLDAACDDEKLRGWQAGTIDGLLAAEGSLTSVTGNSLIRARDYARQAVTLHWPEGIDARRLQRVAGSHTQARP
jgi:hypothetical protein